MQGFQCAHHLLQLLRSFGANLTAHDERLSLPIHLAAIGGHQHALIALYDGPDSLLAPVRVGFLLLFALLTLDRTA
jgi:hypothetical protein